MKIKIIFTSILVILVSIIYFFGYMVIVNANAFNDYIRFGEYVPGIFIESRFDGRRVGIQAQVIRRVSDNAFVYCIEPGVPINNTVLYNSASTNQWRLVNITQEEFNRANLIAYYGYGYANQTDLKWYAITQVMIHRVVAPHWDTFFTNGLWGNRISPYNLEIAQINALVDAHLTRPSFHNSSHTIKLGETITLNDNNFVIDNFKINNNDKLNVTNGGNNLTITANDVGQTNLTLTRLDTRFSTPPIVYYHSSSQNLIRVGQFNPLTINLDFTVLGGRLEFTKIDLVTNKPIPNTKIGIFTEDNQIIFEGLTDENGQIILDDLALGKFYILELATASPDYLLNSEPIWFEITVDNQIIKINMTNEPITTEIVVPDTLTRASIIPKITLLIFILGGIFYSIRYNKK